MREDWGGDDWDVCARRNVSDAYLPIEMIATIFSFQFNWNDLLCGGSDTDVRVDGKRKIILFISRLSIYQFN